MLIYDKDEDILRMEDIDDEIMIQEVMKGGNSQVSAEEQEKGDKTLQEEADTLRQQLNEAKMMVQTLQSNLLLQQAKSNTLNSSLQIKLKRNEEVLRNERVQSDRRLGEVLAHLLFLEGQLKREQKHVQTVMKQKDEVIKSQQEKIDMLTQTNERLVQAVREAYARKGKNGTVLGSLDSCSSESLKENKGKEKDKSSKTPSKGKFEIMRDRLWHHKSNLDLSEPESNMKKLRNRMFSSHENLSHVGKREFNRDKKCRSIAGYPECSDFFPEIPEGNELKGASSSPEQENRLIENDEDLNGDDEEGLKFSAVPFQNYNDKLGMTSVGSLPILSQRDTNAEHSPSKDRPHSMSSMEYYSPPSTKTDTSPTSKSPQSATSSESNPFKNLKTILKRKGSKSKNKKRNVSISQSPAQEVTVKRHFERYDMS